MPQKINYSSSTPAAGVGKRLAKWNADTPSTDPAVVRNISVAFDNLGGTNVQAASSYTIAASDQGKMIVFTSGGAIAVAAPTTLSSNFVCFAQNAGSGSVTITPASGTIDGTSAKTMASGTSCVLLFDGTNWYTLSGGSSSLGTGVFGISIDGGGAVPSTGSRGYLRTPYTGIITAVSLIADASGSAVVTIKRCDDSTFPTTATICGSSAPQLVSSQKSRDATLTGWTTSFSAGDIFEFVLTSVSTCKRLIVEVEYKKTA